MELAKIAKRLCCGRNLERLASSWTWSPSVELIDEILRAAQIRAQLLPRSEWGVQNPFGLPTPKFSGAQAAQAEILFKQLSNLSVAWAKIERQLEGMALAIETRGEMQESEIRAAISIRHK